MMSEPEFLLEDGAEIHLGKPRQDPFSSMAFVETEVSVMAQIRQYFFGRYKTNFLDQNQELGHRLTALMDTIDDTSGATAHYVRSALPETEGGRYLVIYGLLSVLGMQFEALRELFGVMAGEGFLASPLDLDSRFTGIKQTRNDLIHQMNRTKGNKNDSTDYFRVMRSSISKARIEIRRNMDQYEVIDLFQLVEDQHSSVNSDLARFYEALQKADGPKSSARSAPPVTQK
jgi:hypothetical protein